MNVKLGTLLTITTGIYFTSEIFREAKQLVAFMTNEKGVSEMMLYYMSDEITPYLIEQHPFLSEITKEMVAGDNWESNLKSLVEKYGDSFEIVPMHLEDRTPLNPIEALEKYKDEKGLNIETIDLNDDDQPSSFGDINWKV